MKGTRMSVVLNKLASKMEKKAAGSTAINYGTDPKALELNKALKDRAAGREAQEWYDKNQLAEDMKQAEAVSDWDDLLRKAKKFGADYGTAVGVGAGVGGLGGYGIGELAKLSPAAKALVALLGAGVGGTAGWAAKEYGPDLYAKVKAAFGGTAKG